MIYDRPAVIEHRSVPSLLAFRPVTALWRNHENRHEIAQQAMFTRPCASQCGSLSDSAVAQSCRPQLQRYAMRRSLKAYFRCPRNTPSFDRGWRSQVVNIRSRWHKFLSADFKSDLCQKGCGNMFQWARRRTRLAAATSVSLSCSPLHWEGRYWCTQSSRAKRWSLWSRQCSGFLRSEQYLWHRQSCNPT